MCRFPNGIYQVELPLLRAARWRGLDGDRRRYQLPSGADGLAQQPHERAAGDGRQDQPWNDGR